MITGCWVACCHCSAKSCSKACPQKKLSRREGKLCGVKVCLCRANSITVGTESHTVN
ncbi:Uncharacterised protein [Vibrio cholerae]|nr:Uncharacterised protein [Vibrio cholerae]